MVVVSGVAVFMMSSDSFYFLFHKASSKEQPVAPQPTPGIKHHWRKDSYFSGVSWGAKSVFLL